MFKLVFSVLLFLVACFSFAVGLIRYAPDPKATYSVRVDAQGTEIRRMYVDGHWVYYPGCK